MPTPSQSGFRSDRRRFLSTSAALAAGTFGLPTFIARKVLAAPDKPGANERIRVGAIGVGGRATLLLQQLPEGAEIVALSDCNLPRAEAFKASAGGNYPVYQDYRKILDRQDVDAVIVATGEFQRVIPCIHACQAGKDVYAEKPLTLYVNEGRALVNAVRKHGRVLQVGTQQRSMAMNHVAWSAAGSIRTSLEGATAMSLDDDLENLATAAVSDWPEIAFSGRLDGAIRELYRMHLPFPPSWTPDECEEFIEEHADTDAQQLATQFDDAIDVVIDDFGRQNGHLPHHEDASEMIDASRRTMVYELLANIEYLKDELAQLTIHTAGRSPASMTGCSPAARRSHRTTIRRPRGIR